MKRAEDKAMKRIKRVANGPVNLVGFIGRIVEFEDGSQSVQTWGGPDKGWVHGGADVTAVMRAAPALPERLIQYQVPEEDWPPDMLERWRQIQRAQGK